MSLPGPPRIRREAHAGRSAESGPERGGQMGAGGTSQVLLVYYFPDLCTLRLHVGNGTASYAYPDCKLRAATEPDLSQFRQQELVQGVVAHVERAYQVCSALCPYCSLLGLKVNFPGTDRGVCCYQKSALAGVLGSAHAVPSYSALLPDAFVLRTAMLLPGGTQAREAIAGLRR
eukprot:566504-Rhodomonas_salina.2